MEEPQAQSRKSAKASNKEEGNEGQDGDQSDVIPASQRPDGTWRKEVKVKPGYEPAEDDLAAPVVDEKKAAKKAGKMVKKVGGRNINFVSAADDEDSDEDDEDFEAKSGSSGSDDDDDDDESGSDSDDDDSDDDDDDVEDPLANVSTSESGEGFVAYAATSASNSMNEDRFFIGAEQRIFGVFDGHGGAECSQYTIENISAVFAKNYKPKKDKKSKMDGLEGMFFSGNADKDNDTDDKAKKQDDGKTAKDDPTKEALKNTFQAVDLAFLEAHGRDHPTCGSCGLMCLMEEGCVWTANAGDSRAVLVRRTGSRGGCEGVALTVDQNTSCAAECAKVVARSRDKDAVRYNEAEARGGRKEAVKRVAGTLMVTRALGDGYLKDKAYSMPAFCASLPYITSKPKVRRTQLDPRDACVVLASDGVWEHLSNQDVAREVLRSLDAAEEGAEAKAKGGAEGEEGGALAKSCADAVVEATIRVAAAKLSMQAEELRNLKPGNTRRAYVDDLTVLVVHFASNGKKRPREEADEGAQRRVKGKG